MVEGRNDGLYVEADSLIRGGIKRNKQVLKNPDEAGVVVGSRQPDLISQPAVLLGFVAGCCC